MNSKIFGAKGEAVAEGFYRARGFSVLCRNFRTKTGEIDLVMRRGPLLLFVEVKTRSRQWERAAWSPSWAQKNRKLQSTIRWYLSAHPELDYGELRLEVAIVTQGRVVARYDRI